VTCVESHKKLSASPHASRALIYDWQMVSNKQNAAFLLNAANLYRVQLQKSAEERRVAFGSKRPYASNSSSSALLLQNLATNSIEKALFCLFAHLRFEILLASTNIRMSGHVRLITISLPSQASCSTCLTWILSSFNWIMFSGIAPTTPGPNTAPFVFGGT